jgi:sulfoxide reductase heme-binding subunit YedZ
MSVGYKLISWNRQKRIYDTVFAVCIAVYLVMFIVGGALVHPNATIETLLIRAFGTAALLMLHVILRATCSSTASPSSRFNNSASLR